MKFHSTLSTTVIMITMAGNLIGFTYLVYNIAVFDTLAAHMKFIGIYLTCACLMLLFFIRPFETIISESNITIKRQLFPIVIPINMIQDVTHITRADLHGNIRLFASGGFWGYFGLFRSMNYGNIRMHCTNLDNLVLIETATVKYVISPDKAEEFVKAVQGLRLSPLNS